jgi:hypothetical protein
MKTLKQFREESGAGGMGGGAPTNSTGGVAGAGDNPEKIVPVTSKIQKKKQRKGAASEKGLVANLRRMMGAVPC